MPVSRSKDAGSRTFLAQPSRLANDTADWSCSRSACSVCASSAIVVCSLDATNTAYKSLSIHKQKFISSEFYHQHSTLRTCNHINSWYPIKTVNQTIIGHFEILYLARREISHNHQCILPPQQIMSWEKHEIPL
jgi:hypothetical protein